MSKLRLRTGVMGSGKTSTIFNILYDYRKQNKKYLVLKPSICEKGGKQIVNRQGETLDVDYYVFSDEFEKGFREEIEDHKNNYKKIDIIIVDEAQFLEPIMANKLSVISHTYGIPIIAFGLTIDSNGNYFPGMAQLMAIADEIEEITTRTLCPCCDNNKRATKHIKKVDGIYIFNDKQIDIDNQKKVEYISVCSKCFWEIYKKHNKQMEIEDY